MTFIAIYVEIILAVYLPVVMALSNAFSLFCSLQPWYSLLPVAGLVIFFLRVQRSKEKFENIELWVV